MSRLSNISSNPTLQTFAQGAAQSSVKMVAGFLAPTAPVPVATGRFKKYTDKNRYRVPNTRRTLNGRATRIGFDATDALYNCAPNALDFPIDNLESLTDAQLMNMARYGATLLADAASLAHEVEVIDAAVAALTGGGVNINFADDAVDPVKEIDAIIKAVILAAKNGAPVKVLIGAGAWLAIKNNAKVKARVVAGKQGGLVNVSLEEFASLLFGNPQVQLTTVVKDIAAEGLAENMAFVLDLKVIVFASNDTPNTMDPSFMKTFRLDGQWMVPGSYVAEDGRGEVLKMDWSEEIQITNAAAAKLINVQ
ncbi:MAG: hypothetical protein KF715_08605 [Candidatus Didemnitutus sp.]|nr:hypothetical protein [Candidatus Didemnitutus sp.]